MFSILLLYFIALSLSSVVAKQGAYVSDGSIVCPKFNFMYKVAHSCYFRGTYTFVFL